MPVWQVYVTISKAIDEGAMAGLLLAAPNYSGDLYCDTVLVNNSIIDQMLHEPYATIHRQLKNSKQVHTIPWLREKKKPKRLDLIVDEVVYINSGGMFPEMQCIRLKDNQPIKIKGLLRAEPEMGNSEAAEKISAFMDSYVSLYKFYCGELFKPKRLIIGGRENSYGS